MSTDQLSLQHDKVWLKVAPLRLGTCRLLCYGAALDDDIKAPSVHLWQCKEEALAPLTAAALHAYQCLRPDLIVSRHAHLQEAAKVEELCARREPLKRMSALSHLRSA